MNDLLVLAPIHQPTLDALAKEYTLLRFDQAADKALFIAESAPRARAAVTRGDFPVNDELLAGFPNLRMLASYGVGYDGIDAAAAARRGIVITNTPDVLSDCVADAVLALMLATVRRTVHYDRFVRAGAWERGQPCLTGKMWGERLGILGLGRIGLEVARRAAGFKMSIAYHNRRPVPGVSFTYFDSPEALARNVDILVVLLPGGPSTAGIVGRAVIDALGPEGFLINASRGGNIDEEYLIDALREKRLAGAGLDVFAGEPRVNGELTALDTVVLTPHIGSATRHSRNAMGEIVMDNLRRHFAGEAPATPVEAIIPAS